MTAPNLTKTTEKSSKESLKIFSYTLSIKIEKVVVGLFLWGEYGKFAENRTMDPRIAAASIYMDNFSLLELHGLAEAARKGVEKRISTLRWKAIVMYVVAGGNRDSIGKFIDSIKSGLLEEKTHPNHLVILWTT
ncbi:hypothetical protein [Azospirillum rugosum]|uniref:hypothetical protein n=1 Tax=Azospirillum rugosum TaxID=416170 RepID=UPI00277D4525|nr:hypothetical protein [Azospirillum rugosum]MDQ0525050.1 hypothetical protein [Azospirillum rugosum]